MYHIIRTDNNVTLDIVEVEDVADTLSFWYGQGIPCLARPDKDF